ncbi:ribosomal-protein-S5-alanine N-acetyltransferase [Anaerotruncus sp. 2789STDY5834896]|uniref:Ribosomal-protein-S5-alanine N-acetyltransferase n=1 Tax=uncultured Anaerotruncus sp. TaxID=905011 RepID=A0A1C6K8W5_9FIRM|nr:ribosomal-protein-S5-alanine N-acetyltransferase [uncultured Anaerotruncus sp.]
MKNQYIQLVPADLSLAEQVIDYYRRNRDFLEAFEPIRSEEFFSLEYQQEVLRNEMKRCKEKTAFRFYIKSTDHPQKIIGIIGLNNVVWGAFCSAFLGYKLDVGFVNKGYMSMAVGMLTKYAFEELGLHRIEANVMPKNRASLRVLEKNQFINEGLSKYYLNINGIWEDHIHMVKINYDMHEIPVCRNKKQY